VSAAEYSFLTHWRFDDARLTEVADIIEDTISFSRWWPQLFKAVTVVKPGTDHGLGQVAYCECRARLPYTLRFTYTVVNVNYPNGSTVSSTGDLIGTGIWRLTQRDSGVDADYEWTVRLEKPFLRLLSPIARPFLAANHEWSMARGQEGLRDELIRRRQRHLSAR
jgi:hypothetical protein